MDQAFLGQVDQAIDSVDVSIMQSVERSTKVWRFQALGIPTVQVRSPYSLTRIIAAEAAYHVTGNLGYLDRYIGEVIH